MTVRICKRKSTIKTALNCVMIRHEESKFVIHNLISKRLRLSTAILGLCHINAHFWGPYGFRRNLLRAKN